MNDKKHREQHRDFTDKDFRWGKEIDNKDLRYLLTKPGELSYSENERFGFYVYALIDVLCGNPHFCNLHYFSLFFFCPLLSTVCFLNENLLCLVPRLW